MTRRYAHRPSYARSAETVSLCLLLMNAPSPRRERESASQPAVVLERVVVGVREQLDSDMVRPGVEMGVKLSGHLCVVAMGNQGVDQRVAAASGQIAVAPAETAKVVRVVVEPEVRISLPAPCRRPGRCRDRGRGRPCAPAPAARWSPRMPRASACAPASPGRGERRRYGRRPVAAPSARAPPRTRLSRGTPASRRTST